MALSGFVIAGIGCGPEAERQSSNPNAPSTESPSADETPVADQGLPPQAVTLSGEDFELELALDHDTRFQGLSDRAFIPTDGGMLFVFPRPRRLEFVMRRCLVPIDIIFLDPGGRITAMHAMQVEPYDRPEAQLKRYSSRYPAQFAIELAGGTLARLQLRAGDAVDLPLDDLKRGAQ